MNKTSEEPLNVRGSDLIASFLAFACRDLKGWAQKAPAFEIVTEGRQSPKYSSCADLAHALLFWLGVRATWVNRKECHGWRSGLGVQLICARGAGGGNSVARTWTPKKPFDLAVGDILVVNSFTPTTTHVEVVREAWSGGPVLNTADYGQFDSKLGLACGRYVDRKFDGKKIGDRTLNSVLRIEDALAFAETALCLEPAFTLDALEEKADTFKVPNLKQGDWSGAVEYLQVLLPPLEIDGKFGPVTRAEVMQVQGENGFASTGIVDQPTWEMIRR